MMYFNKKFRKMLLIASSLALTCSGSSCGSSYSRKVISNESIKLTPDWVEFLPEQPLGCELDTHELVLELATSFKLNTSMHPPTMLLEDNSPVNPEVQVLDDQGRVHPLHITSFSLPKAAVYSCSALPDGTKIRSIQIRSDKPLQTSSVQWLCYNFKDVKR